MKVTLNWLKEFVDFSLSPKELSEALTMVGLEVEEYHAIERNFSGVIVGKVVAAQKHSEAHQLTVCQVDTGGQTVAVVCGAPNVTVGMKAPFALEGAILADGRKVEVKDIRGLTSHGMLCSEAELGLSERAEGLMVLPESAPVGKDLHAVLGAPDVVFDIAVTPNRPDCLSVIGIAREVAAITGAPFKIPTVTLAESGQAGENPFRVEIKDSQRCFRYSGRLLKNILIQPSPYWMSACLHAVGVRSINNVVDITNYVMMETGLPLHAFDSTMLEGQKIIVRTAKAGEKFVTLDGQERTLDDQALLICDANKPVALAGIMGGQNSEVESDTESVFLESAYFEPVGIRRTSKKLDLASESSRRFERGIDPNGTLFAMNRSAQLMIEHANAEIVGHAVDEYPSPVMPVEIDLSGTAANNLLGTSLTNADMSRILAPLDIKLVSEQNDKLTFRVPTSRPDLTREVDLIEEIARHYGYDNIPVATSAPIDFRQTMNERVAFKDRLRRHLSGFGFKETVSLSLVHPSLAKAFLPPESELVELLNPLSPELSTFRTNLILSLLNNVAYNRNRQMQNLRFFEIGDAAWRIVGKKEVLEKCQVAGIFAGKRIEQNWNQKAEPFDYYDIKGAVTGLLDMIGIHAFEMDQCSDAYWAEEISIIKADGRIIGTFGKISNDICSLFKIKVPDVYAFCLDFDSLYELSKKQKIYDPIPRYPSVPFDMALVIDVNIPIGQIEREIWRAGGAHLVNVHLFDYYRGEQVAKDKKSIAFSLTFSSKERTLDENDIQQAIQKILAHLKSLFAAELRLK